MKFRTVTTHECNRDANMSVFQRCNNIALSTPNKIAPLTLPNNHPSLQVTPRLPRSGSSNISEHGEIYWQWTLFTVGLLSTLTRLWQTQCSYRTLACLTLQTRAAVRVFKSVSCLTHRTEAVEWTLTCFTFYCEIHVGLDVLRGSYSLQL